MRWLESAALAFCTCQAATQADCAEPGTRAAATSMSADQVLGLAERALAAGDVSAAETAYRALFTDSSVAVRSEARFRLAQILFTRRRLAEAAILLRMVLDEQPAAQRVRLELARLLQALGDETGARRALREAQAGGLPPGVAEAVERYSAALRANKPFGATLDVAFAQDSNINRATRSSTLGTVLGDFALDSEARQRSGLGLALRGQIYARLPLNPFVNLLGRVSGSADLYGASAFNDIALGVSAGPEFRRGVDRFAIEGGLVGRRYGGRPYSRAATVGLSMLHPLRRTAELRGSAAVGFVDNRLNDSQDGHSYSATLGYERALSSRAGVGASLTLERQALADPAYSTRTGQISAFGYRESGPLTLIATASLGRLRADQALFLFPAARNEQSFRASLSATWRQMRLGSMAPFVRISWERNASNIVLYDSRRWRGEFGLTRIF